MKSRLDKEFVGGAFASYPTSDSDETMFCPYILQLNFVHGWSCSIMRLVFKIEALVRVFILKCSQISTSHLKGWFKSKTAIQEYINEIQNSY